MLWIHHQEAEGALAHGIMTFHSNNNSNTERVRAPTFAQACVLSEKLMRKPSPRDERATGQMNRETGRKV